MWIFGGQIMREELLGALYCLGACIVIFYAWFMVWHLLDKVEEIVYNFKNRNNRWR